MLAARQLDDGGKRLLPLTLFLLGLLSFVFLDLTIEALFLVGLALL